MYRMMALGILSGLLVGVLVPVDQPSARPYSADPAPQPASGITISGGNVKVIKVDRIITIQEDMEVVSEFPFKLTASAGGSGYVWNYPPGITATRKRNVLEITAAAKGTYTVSIDYDLIDWDAKKVVPKTESKTFAVGVPGPGPKPPTPPDPPTPAPQGFRVLLIHEAQEKSPAFFDGRVVKQYLDAKCVKDGNQPSWRRLDKDQTGANLPADLRLLWEAAKPKVTAVPCVVIAVNSQVTIHPLPSDEAGLIALLKSKGGE